MPDDNLHIKLVNNEPVVFDVHGNEIPFGNPLGINYLDVQLTHAQILALNTTSIQIVPAPGVNKSIIFHQCYLLLDARSGAYGGAWNAAPANVSNLTIPDSVPSFSGVGAVLIARVANTGNNNHPGNNEALYIFNDNAAATGGNVNNTLSIRTWYSVVPAIPFS